MAARRALILPIPEDALAEDAVISHRIAEQGYTIRYAPAAEVYVKYPTTYADWRRLDELECSQGAACGRPRLKFASIEEMLAALGRAVGN